MQHDLLCGKAEGIHSPHPLHLVFGLEMFGDVLVFASPVYWWDIMGTLKTAIDRLYAAVNNRAADDFRRIDHPSHG